METCHREGAIIGSYYNGNTGGGPNTSPSPATNTVPSVYILSDGEIITSAQAQQSLETLADWCAFNTGVANGNLSQKALYVDGVGGLPYVETAGDGYIKGNLLTGGHIISDGSIGASTSLSVGTTSTFVGPAQFIGGIDTSLNGITSNQLSTSAPVFGSVYGDMQTIGQANVSVAVGGAVTVNYVRGLSATVTRASLGIFQLTLLTASTSTNHFSVFVTLLNSDNTSASIVKVINTSASTFTISMWDTSFTAKDSNFCVRVDGII